MLGLYLYTLIISHKSSNMLRILNKLTLFKKLQTFVTNNVFLDKKVKTQQQQNKKSNIKTLARAGDWTQDLLHPKRMRYQVAPPSLLRVSIVVKLFNCFDAMGRNVNKQSQICGPDIFNKFIFSCNICACMKLYLAVSHIYGSRFRCLNMIKM